MKHELLAPAGDIEAGYAALHYGADALYLGLKEFSARATAGNFSDAELYQITGYAHSLGRKVFVAINTLVQNEQLESLHRDLDLCLNAHVDGVIVQDLGVAYIVRQSYPELELHASTQMAVHNKQGALYLKSLGFKRVVLARELTMSEIQDIASVPNLETECFIHGALCYAYSGICQFSSFETGMSANRGKCLYPCRACFDGDLGHKHLFSMKDMALEKAAVNLPAYSLKIEGRKKSALYVAAVVNYYRKLLDGQPVDGLADDIKQIFARPWTSFHLNGKNKSVIDTEFVGHRGLNIGKVNHVVKGWMQVKLNTPVARYDGIQIDTKGQEKPFGFSVEKMRLAGKNVFEAGKGAIVEIALPEKPPFIEKNADVYLASSSRVKGSYHYTKPKPDAFKYRMPIEVEIWINENEVVAKSAGVESHLSGDFVRAKDDIKVQNAVQSCFEKTGNTDLMLNQIILHNDNKLFVPVSVLNELRRMLYDQISVQYESHKLPLEDDANKTTKQPKWIIKTDDLSCIKELELKDFDEVIVCASDKLSMDEISKLPKIYAFY